MLTFTSGTTALDGSRITPDNVALVVCARVLPLTSNTTIAASIKAAILIMLVSLLSVGPVEKVPKYYETSQPCQGISDITDMQIRLNTETNAFLNFFRHSGQ